MTSRPRLPTRVVSVLSAAGAGLAATAVLLAAAPSAAADTPWGNTGAYYSGGIVCRLGDTVVPMTTWDVEGTATFATADVSATGGGFGPAPTTGSAAPIQLGEGGLADADVPALAYLIAHHGNGSAADVANVSADVAVAAGRGGLQQACLGQQGTSGARAGALLDQARRYAGPYQVALSLPGRVVPNKTITIGARVTSAVGAPTPGIQVTFAANGGSAVAQTGADGQAHTQITTAGATSTPVTATISEPISLTYYATDPGAVSPASPTTVSDSGTLAPALPPKPHVTTHAPGLVLRDGTVTAQAVVTGTNGYAGNGSISVVGPVPPGSGKACSSLTAADYAKAAVAWQGDFSFTGDGTHQAGKTPQLTAGCYAAHASITTTDSSPPARATSGYASTIVVTNLALTESAVADVVPAGGLAATVTGSDAGGAQVKTSITAHGPLTPNNGSCAGDLDWNAAPVAGVSDPVPLTAASGASGSATASASPSGAAPAIPSTSASPAGSPGDLAATIKVAGVDKVGCYALSARSVVTQNGQSLVVEPAVGESGTTTLLAKPELAINDGHYDGELGKPMTGTITVVGSYHYPATLSIGLTSAPRTDVGCREATFGQHPVTVPAGPLVTSATTGDGIVQFATPPARKNLCYAVTAVLRLKANPAVQATSPAPSTSSIFLAGVVLHTPTASGMPGNDSDALQRTLIAGAITLGVIFAVAFTVIVRAFRRRVRDTA